MGDYYSDEEEYVTSGDVLKECLKYEGDRNELGERHGFGKATYDNGEYYEGEYKEGMRNGQGKYKFKSARYIGSYKNGKRDGFGTMIYPDGSKYKGQWKDGERHGEGEYTFVNGDKFEGEYERGLRHGFGIYHYHETGGQFAAEWIQGIVIGPGSWKTNGYLYEGNFRDHYPYGEGKFTFNGGCEQSGHHSLKNVFRKVGSKTECVGKVPNWQAQTLGYSDDV